MKSHKPLLIGIAQLDNSLNWKHNFLKAKRVIKYLKKKEVDIICFGEAFLSGYHAKVFEKDYFKIDSYLDELKDLAHQLDVSVILPTFIKKGKYFYSCAYLFNTDHGDKIFYKEGLTASEKKVLRSKKGTRVFSVKGTTFGILMCREVEDPAFTYFSKISLPDIILWPSYWGWTYRMKWGPTNYITHKRDKCFWLIKRLKRPMVQINMATTLMADMTIKKFGKSVVVNADAKRQSVAAYGKEDLFVVSYTNKSLKRL